MISLRSTGLGKKKLTPHLPRTHSFLWIPDLTSSLISLHRANRSIWLSASDLEDKAGQAKRWGGSESPQRDELGWKGLGNRLEGTVKQGTRASHTGTGGGGSQRTSIVCSSDRGGGGDPRSTGYGPLHLPIRTSQWDADWGAAWAELRVLIPTPLPQQETGFQLLHFL